MSIHYPGPYAYDHSVVSNWDSSQIGVYFCGYLSYGKIVPLYIGRAIGDGGIRCRLLQHLLENKWPEVTHFCYNVCGSDQEAINFEAQQIALHQPKYNIQGRRVLWP